jgi:glycosyltransferase involved in cell wall biosynthesis
MGDRPIKVVYLSDIDISLPDYGPSVNEREFVWMLQAELGEEASFIIPTPSKKLDFELRNAEYYQGKFLKSSSRLLRILSVTWHMLRLVLRKVRDSEIDLFVVRMEPDSILVPLFLLLLRQRYSIKTLENIYKFHYQNLGLKKRIFFSIGRKILGIVLRNALMIDVCTTQFYHNYKQRYNLENIELIENAVNVDRFYLMDRKECKRRCGLERFGKIVGYCGGYPSERGARHLVEILPRLALRHPDCGVLIVGDDSELPLIKERAKELRVDKHIIFKGIVEYEDLPPYINCLDVGIGLDAEEKIKFTGNSSQKIRQYLACGVPVICSEGTNEKIIEEGLGRAVPPNDLDQIYQAICFWLEKSAKDVEEFRRRARQFAEDNLSTEVAFRKRYTAWKEMLKL